MSSLTEKLAARFKQGIERERHLESKVESFSMKLWPYPVYKLVVYISILALLDYSSTFSALELSGNHQISEVGVVDRWALERGGFRELFIVDIICIGTLISLAFGVRFFYEQLGFKGFGRAAMVLLLCPYLVVIMGVVLNNVLLTFIT